MENSINKISQEQAASDVSIQPGAFFDKVFSISNFPMAILNHEFEYIRVNTAFAAIQHQEPAYYSGKNHFLIFPDGISSEQLHQSLDNGEPVILYSCPYIDSHDPEKITRYLDWRFELTNSSPEDSQILLSVENVTRRVQMEDAFNRAEIRFDHIFEAQPDANILVDKTGKIEALNHNSEILFGYLRHELINQPVEILVPERFRGTHIKHMLAYAAEPRLRPLGSGLELFGRRKNGEEFPIDITLNPRITQDGLLTLAVIRDISQNRRAEVALKEQTEFVKLLSDVAIASNEAESIEGALLFTLDRVCEFTKWPIGHAILRNSSGDLESTRLWHLDDPVGESDFVRLSETLKWESGEGLPGLVLTNGKAAWVTQISTLDQFKRRSEATRIGVKSGFAFPIWSGREVVGVLEFFSTETTKPQPSMVDIMPSIGTQIGRVIERKRIEDERRAQGTRLLTVLNTLPVGVFVADEAGLIIMANQAGQDIWGEFRSVGIDQYDEYKAWWFETGERIQSNEWALARALKNNETTLDELINIETFTGIKKTLLNSAFPLHDSQGNISGAIVVNQDVTERMKMESELAEVQRRLLESVEAERLHLARELHDGPIQDLYSTNFYIQDAAGAIQSSQGTEALEAVRTTIQQVISMLRVICGELRPPALAPFGLEKAIRSHIEQVHETNPSMTFRVDLDVDNQQLPEAVRLGLYRIYHQLVTNTIRHANAREISVSFKLQPDEVILEVRDDGIGFDPPSRWIDLARQGHLGLVGASERAESLGGSFSIESAPGKGTVIRTVIPRADLQNS